MTDSLAPNFETSTFERRVAPADPAWLHRLARRGVRAALTRLREGEIRLRDSESDQRFGGANGDLGRVRVEVHDPAFYSNVGLGGTLGGAESYMRGDWDCDDLPRLIRMLVRNRDALEGFDRGVSRLAAPLRRLGHWRRRNSRSGSRRNIAAHYDLGNEFFSLFLDPTLTYSCGVFEHEDATLEEASRAKYERLCKRIGLEAGHHVLEIGTGWGGFALHAAERGAAVTTTTISAEQHALARERVRAAGLADRVTLRLDDYRDLGGRYDRLVSIEMIEAVGLDHLAGFFECCSERLRPDGRMGLQAIVIRDQEFARARRGVDFIQRYIFPGGALPSVRAIVDACAEHTDLRLSHLEDLTPHYAETLRRWRERFLANREEIASLGFDEEFLRMWDFYLAYCEGGFEERNIGVVQMVLEKPRAR